MLARYRPNGPRGRSVLKSTIGSPLYPEVNLHPATSLYPREESSLYSYRTLDNPTVDQVNAATQAYLGGHIYYVTIEEAALLEAAGYTTLPDPAPITGPNVNFLSPRSDTNISGVFTVRLFYDTGATIELWMESQGNVVNFTWVQGATTLTIDSTAHTNGTYRLKARATNAAGLQTTVFVDINIVNVIIPDTPPTLTPSATLLPSPSLVL